MLTIGADFSGAESAETSVDVSHYGIVEGDNLRRYILVQSFVLLNIVIMAFTIFSSIQSFVGAWCRGDHEWTDLIEPSMDLMVCVLVVVFIVLMVEQKLQSAEQSALIVDSLTSIPWGDPTIPLQDKKANFFENVYTLLALIDKESFNNILCNIILLVNLFRVSKIIVLCLDHDCKFALSSIGLFIPLISVVYLRDLQVIQGTSLHPRLALLTGTIANALDDLW